MADIRAIQRELFAGQTPAGERCGEESLLQMWPTWLEWSRHGSHPQAHAALVRSMAENGRAPSGDWREGLGAAAESAKDGRHLSSGEVELLQRCIAAPSQPFDGVALSQQIEASLVFLTECVLRECVLRKKQYSETSAPVDARLTRKREAAQDIPEASESKKRCEKIVFCAPTKVADEEKEEEEEEVVGAVEASVRRDDAEALVAVAQPNASLGDAVAQPGESRLVEVPREEEEEEEEEAEASGSARPTRELGGAEDLLGDAARNTRAEPAIRRAWTREALSEPAMPTRVVLHTFETAEAADSGVPSTEDFFEVDAAQLSAEDLLMLWKRNYVMADGGVELEFDGEVLANDQRLAPLIQKAGASRRLPSFVVIPSAQ